MCLSASEFAARAEARIAGFGSGGLYSISSACEHSKHYKIHAGESAGPSTSKTKPS